LDGPPISAGHGPESQPGYDAELAALDLQALPELLSIADLTNLERALAAFMLEVEDLPDSLSRDELLANAPMGPAIAGAFAVQADANQEGLNLDFLRRGLHRYYACARQQPQTLQDFKDTVYDFSILPAYPVESEPKDGPRLLRQDIEQLLYVAETYDNGIIRETEIMRGGIRKDGALEFFVYDEDGKLANRSHFPTQDGGVAVTSAPFTCLTCHVNFETMRFDVLQPNPVNPFFDQQQAEE
jgi:hypothetical protein